MDFNKEYFLNYLRNGGDMDSIGRDIADAMNDAREAYEAEKAIAAKAAKENEMLQTKRDIAAEMIDLIVEYGELVAPGTSEMLQDYTDEDLDQMIETMDQLFNMLKAIAGLKNAVAAAPVKPVIKTSVKVPKTDDEVLANFIKKLM
jgi:hypothetical protein